MSFANRYARIGSMHAANTIPEGDVMRRVMTAIRTIRAMPDGERRFLIAGSKSGWVQYLYDRGDQNSQAETVMTPLERLARRGRIPQPEQDEIAALVAGPPMPERAGDTIQQRLRQSREGLAENADPLSHHQHLPRVKYAPKDGSLPSRDEEQPQTRDRLKRAEISDALIAGSWFASVAVLPENVAEFENRIELYRIGKKKSAQVDDQRILSWLAFGWSIQSIAQHQDIDTNEHQVERRINEISRNLWRIANGTARLCDIEERQRNRERTKAGNAFRRERA